MSRIDALQISTAETDKALTPEQKRFNTLIRQIGQVRQTLAAWHGNISVSSQAHAQVLLPIEASLMATHREWVFVLDALLGQPVGPARSATRYASWYARRPANSSMRTTMTRH